MTIYRAAGEPPVEWSEPGVCRLCGAEDQGQAFGRWVKDTFTNHDLLCPGEIVCRGCLILTENFSAFYQRLLGRDKPQKPWNWSHFVLDGQYIVLSKGDKARMVDVLMRSPEVAVIADSGQKHIAFRASLGVWQFELQPIRADPDLLSTLISLTTDLYTGGANKSEILTGRYAAKTIQRVGVRDWREWELGLRPYRGSPMLELAVFLTQKKETDDERGNSRGATPTEAGGQYALL